MLGSFFQFRRGCLDFGVLATLRTWDLADFGDCFEKNSKITEMNYDCEISISLYKS